MLKILKKSLLIIFLTLIFLVLLSLYSYTTIIPKIITNPTVIEHLHNAVNKLFDAELLIVKPKIKPDFDGDISISVENIFLAKNGETLISTKNFACDINISKLLSQKLILNKLGADSLYIDLNKLKNIKIVARQQKAMEKSNFIVDWFNAVYYIKQCAIIYGSPKGVIVKFLSRGISSEAKNNRRYIHFNILVDTDYQNERLRVLLEDKDNIYTENDKLYINNFIFKVNNSEILTNAIVNQNKTFNLNLKSDNYEFRNIVQALNTNLLIPNGREIMSCFKDLKGYIHFNLNINDKEATGAIGIKNLQAKIAFLADIPITMTQGAIILSKDNIDIKDFKGYYDKSKKNEITMYGKTLDYARTAKTALFLNGIANNAISPYMSKLLGVKISLINTSKAAFKIDFDCTGKTKIIGGGKIPKKSNLLFDGMSISSDNFERAYGIDMFIDGENTFINHINYYIADYISEKKVETAPIFTVKGVTNTFTGFIKEMEFNIPQALPSEFLNVLMGQQVLRQGTCEGAIKYTYKKVPKITGNMILKGVIVVGQRFLIKNAEITANNDLIHIISSGSIRRTNYDFNAEIVNNLLFPVIVNKIKLDVEDLDVERIMQTFGPTDNTPHQNLANRPILELPKSDVPLEYFEVQNNQNNKQKSDTKQDISDTPIQFQPNLLVIKECLFNVKKGVYKLIKFGNLNANLTLTKDGLLKITSNKFDFAEGTSSLNVDCDLYKENYSIKLDAENVNSDILSTSILNLNKEISGKASADMYFFTDKGRKLNGDVKFSIVDGQISKLGVIQYVLTLASIFRNPLAMISFSTLVDLVSIPDGTFKSINGTLNIADNVIEKMRIKANSPYLSSYIKGKLNLETFDATITIYTKTSNRVDGIIGFLRNLSLYSISRKMHIKEDTSIYNSDIATIPKLKIDDKHAKVFITTVNGNINSTNFISSLRQIK